MNPQPPTGFLELEAAYTDLALEALASVTEGGLSPEGIGIATIDVETETFGKLSDDEKEQHLEAAGLLADPEAEDEDADEE
ncbi:hypothetical protein BRC96_06685 [Halobacteriales archaeon QS_6_64_34]|nr:MAG: hypothetical protein BRC96_06685 [Halobacteriales archaeon QS_6_64_34]